MDAGALVMLLADAGPVGEALRTRVQGERLLAPYLVDVEVTSALLGRHRGGKLTEGELDDALAAFAVLPVRRLEHVPLLPRVRELYANLSAYDATYVALAEGFDVPLVTSDGRIKDGARAKQAKCLVEVFNEKTVPPSSPPGSN
ncbi:type II toxin-antitoxin system VapC family toxin [Streptomyces sp. NBC_00322]|uniref:type II toxin-antitoxin system VapC family toxin n=1 Tax=Streptomyces sp. NBC_00322 TaxID=2975712 RepID=UPI002E2BE9D3|nr:type II toxin-antitoxin system VapC family toxin [Streptomyces sp. NBC_00322]